MTDLLFPLPAVPSLKVKGKEARFPVRRVYCVGRNYAAHSVEMGSDPNREEPFFFQKNPDNLDQTGAFPYPERTDNVHYEVEMLVALEKGGRNICADNALDNVFGYAVSIDMTRRDIQAIAKNMRRPWEMAKAFERSAPCSELVAASDIGHLTKGAITLDLNGERQQSGDLYQMIWKVQEIISYLSDFVELAAGDVILTGTPSGVGPVKRGDVMLGAIEGIGSLSVDVI